MYTPSSFREDRIENLHEMIRSNNFGILVTHNNEGAPEATHIPFMIDSGPGSGEYGTLVTHMARANKHWRSWNDDTVAMVIFRGPHSYISPSWYADRVTVPTWNYAAVHASGNPAVIHDTVRLREIVTELVHFHESQVENEWSIEEAESIMDKELKAIVGVEIRIDNIEGKMKFNQNRSSEDRQGVIDHLSKSENTVEREVAGIMKRNLCPHQRDLEHGNE